MTCVRAAVRAALLRSIAAELEAAGGRLIETAATETHLGEQRLRGELARTTSQFEAFAKVVEDGSWAAARIDLGPPDLRRMMWPIGPVIVFGASNFPLPSRLRAATLRQPWRPVVRSSSRLIRHIPAPPSSPPRRSTRR